VDNFLVLANNQNNTDGDIQVVQDPADRLVAQKDIFNEGPIVETVAHYQSHVPTSSEDPDNLKDLEAKISLIKETSPKSITSDLTPDHAHLPQSQTSYAPPTRCVTVSESNTQAQPGKIQHASVIPPRETPYTVPPKFQCDQCDFSSPSQHGLKIHTGKAHKLHTVDLSSTARDPADAKRSREYRLREKIKEDNAVEKLKSLKEQNKNLKDQKAQLRTRVEQSLFK